MEMSCEFTGVGAGCWCVVMESARLRIDAGRLAIGRAAGEKVAEEANIFAGRLDRFCGVVERFEVIHFAARQSIAGTRSNCDDFI